MDQTDTRRVLEILGYALEKSGRELDAYLDSVCGEDSLLRRKVLDYLKFDFEGSIFAAAATDGTAPEIPDANACQTRYDLGDEIARGGMGTIFQAYDRNLRRDVAIKVLKKGSGDEPETIVRFIREAQISGQLQHPGIAPTYDIGRLPDRRPFIAMKLVKGTTLARLLADRTDDANDQTRLLGVFQQVCQTVAFAQSRGVIHRDVKPANVMVGEFGEVQVMDWGLARTVAEGKPEEAVAENGNEKATPAFVSKVETESDAFCTQVGQIMGTPAYMPPEQLFGFGDQRIDVFSLGSILCEILTGEPTACDLDAAVERLNRSEFDPDLIQLARDCIERCPADRPKDAGVVAKRVSANLNAIRSRLREAEVARARAEGRAEFERQARHRTLRTIAGVATLLITAAIVISLISNSIRQQQRRERAHALVNQLLTAESAQVPAILEQFEPYRRWANPLLKTEFTDAARGSREKLHVAVALLPDETQVRYLQDELPSCALEQFPLARESIRPHKDQVTDGLWQLVQNEEQDGARRFQAAAALARYAPDDERWKDVAPFVANYLTSQIPSVYVDDWLQLFEPASSFLTDPLAAIHADGSRSQRQREEAAIGLADYLRDQPDRLACVILAAGDITEFAPLIDELRPHSASVKQQLVAEMQSPMPNNLSVTQRDAHWKRQSMAAVTLVHLGQGEEVWHLLQLTPDPSLRSFIIHHLGKFNADHNTLAARLEAEREISIRRALIQSMGGLNPMQIPPSDRKRIADQLKRLYVHDHDPGVHGAALWTLRRWGVELPVLPVGEPVLSEGQEQLIARLDARAETIKQRISACENEELPARQIAWEQQLRKRTATLPAALSEGLVAHYPLDEIADAKTSNSVDQQAGGTYQGATQPATIPGVVGSALRLDATGSYIDCGQAVQPDSTDLFTFACWFFVDAGSRRGVLFAKFDNAARRGFAVNIDPSREKVLCEWSHRYPASTLIVHAKANNLVGCWHHLVVTYDGSSSADGVGIYLDGQSIPMEIAADRLEGSIQTANPAQIGRRDTSYSFQGNIDDVRVYDRVLNQKEVSQLYDSGVRTLAAIPAEQRTSDLNALLAAIYRPLDEPLLRLEDQLAELEAESQEARRNASRRWYVNSQGQTMAVVEDMLMNGDPGIKYSFAICGHEVTQAEYDHFRNKPSLSSDSDELNRPVCGINWYTAAEYCNWLSELDGIPEDQWVYEPNADGSYWEGMRIKDNFLELTGYRLPTGREWVHACRAETKSTYSFGEPVELVNRYGVNAMNSFSRSQPVQSLLPNDAGLFDMHGNLQEWTMDSASGPLSPVTHAVYRITQSPEYTRQPEQLQTKTSHEIPPQYTSYVIGFRPVRTFRLPSR